MEPIPTKVIMLKKLTRHLCNNHPRENRPHQGIQTRAKIGKRLMKYATLERWINIILRLTQQIYISIQHQQKGNI